MGVLSPWKEAVPAVLVLVAETPKIHPNVLDLPLSLAVGLWMISGCETSETPRRLKKARQTLEMNFGPRSEMMSLGMPKFLKT